MGHPSEMSTIGTTLASPDSGGLYCTSYSLADVREILPTASPYDESTIGSPDWAGGTYNSAVRMALHAGMPEVASRLEESARQHTMRIASQGHSILATCYDVAGSYMDLDRYLAREPDCMISYQDQIQDRIVRIAVDICHNCDVRAETIRRRGEAIYVLIRAIELAGYSVGLSVYNYQTSTHNSCYEIRVKEPQEYIDPAIVAYYLTSASAQRRVMFRLRESRPAVERKSTGIPGGYGRAAEISDLAATTLWGSDTVLRIGSAYAGYAADSVDTLLSRAGDRLRDQGVDLAM